ncbi:MAG: VOC family protein [Verrucomicrobia bacterium]|nr:VOC family protein [Verrucomicrobiota bacterium]
MITQLAHICIHASDLDETYAFYHDALGLEKGFEFEKDGEPYGYYLKCGGQTFIEVFKGTSGEEGNIKHVAIEVEDMDGLIQRIREHGIEIGEKTLGCDHSWQVWVTDPNGVRIEFHEYTEKSMQRVGGTCIVSW